MGRGWLSGLIGVIIFSGSLPATRLAVADLDPLFLTAARACIAAVLGAGLLVAMGAVRPGRRDLLALVTVSLGVVLGFPLLTALALRGMTAAHAVLFIGLLPLATAIFGVLRGGDRPRWPFWLFSAAGSACVAAFSLSMGGEASLWGDALMLAAIIVCGWGYAEGARLSRRIGGLAVIVWALILALPAMLPLALATAPRSGAAIGWPALAALAYVSLFSMLIGFLFWYRGLALGGTAGVGQLQLLQPFFGLALAALVLGEPVGAATILTAAAVLVCVAGARRFA